MSSNQDMQLQITNQVDEVITMTVLRRTGKAILDRIANGEQNKYIVKHGGKHVFVLMPFCASLELNLAEQVISSTELLHGKEILKRIAESGLKQFIIMRMNKPIAIVMPVDYGMDIVMYELEAVINRHLLCKME